EQGNIRTTHQFGGLGLGLAICKAIIDMHGGSIRAHSDGPGTGATFTVELSVAVAARGETPAAQSAAVGNAGEPLSVLRVEDHPDTREVLAKLLRASNYAVKTASS